MATYIQLSDQPPLQGTPKLPRLLSSGGGQIAASCGSSGMTDVVQFTCPMYYVEENEDVLVIDVMRLGSMHGVVRVAYSTENGSAKAGEKFESASGVIELQTGEYRKSIEIRTIKTGTWAATLEFKVNLSNPENCHLGKYLHSCRVKVMDNDPFPSSRFKDLISQGPEGIEQIPGFGLLSEFFKLIFFSVPGIKWRTFVTCTFDQVHNLYMLLTTCLSAYMVDVIFSPNEEESNDSLIFASRKHTAWAVALLFVLPMILLNIWDYLKVRINTPGYIKLFLQTSLFRKYLNYSEESRAKVLPADVQSSVLTSCAIVADGYGSLLALLKILGQLGIFVYYTIHQSGQALPFVLGMPLFMVAFATYRSFTTGEYRDEVEAKISELLHFTADVCARYRLVADYFQRPKMNDIFSKKAAELNDSMVPSMVEELQDEYFPKWMGPLCIAGYIATAGPDVLEGKLSMGTFLALVSVIKEISCEFTDGYLELLKVIGSILPLRSLCVLFNMQTDLPQFKAINRQRREASKAARDLVMKEGATSDGKQGDKIMFKSDLIPLELRNVSFGFPDSKEPLLKNINVSVPQGQLVAIVGPHGSGKATLLQLIGHIVFPDQGSIFIPSHLRVLHVTQEAMLLNLSPFKNLTFGLVNPNSADQNRIRAILTKLKMKHTLALVEEDLCNLSTAVAVRSEHEQSADKTGEDQVEGTPSWDQKVGTGSWQEGISYTEKVKMHLARALIANPEVLVLQRPLSHYDDTTGHMIMQMLREVVSNRGFCMPEEEASCRRPRTIFYSAESKEQAEFADEIWHIGGGTVSEVHCDLN